MTIKFPIKPRTVASAAALAVAERFYSPELLDHCLRSYAFAAEYGYRNQIFFDDELLYVGAMLHDIALARELDSHEIGFDVASGHIAWILATGLGWSKARRQRLVEVVLAHMLDEVDIFDNPEGFLLERSTSWDISGRHQQDLPQEWTAELIRLHPRQGIAKEFLGCFQDQATRKPESSAARAIRNGISERILSNPLDLRANTASEARGQ